MLCIESLDIGGRENCCVQRGRKEISDIKPENLPKQRFSSYIISSGFMNTQAICRQKRTICFNLLFAAFYSQRARELERSIFSLSHCDDACSCSIPTLYPFFDFVSLLDRPLLVAARVFQSAVCFTFFFLSAAIDIVIASSAHSRASLLNQHEIYV